MRNYSPPSPSFVVFTLGPWEYKLRVPSECTSVHQALSWCLMREISETEAQQMSARFEKLGEWQRTATPKP